MADTRLREIWAGLMPPFHEPATLLDISDPDDRAVSMLLRTLYVVFKGQDRRERERERGSVRMRIETFVMVQWIRFMYFENFCSKYLTLLPLVVITKTLKRYSSL